MWIHKTMGSTVGDRKNRLTDAKIVGTRTYMTDGEVEFRYWWGVQKDGFEQGVFVVVHLFLVTNVKEFKSSCLGSRQGTVHYEYLDRKDDGGVPDWSAGPGPVPRTVGSTGGAVRPTIPSTKGSSTRLPTPNGRRPGTAVGEGHKRSSLITCSTSSFSEKRFSTFKKHFFIS